MVSQTQSQRRLKISDCENRVWTESSTVAILLYPSIINSHFENFITYIYIIIIIIIISTVMEIKVIILSAPFLIALAPPMYMGKSLSPSFGATGATQGTSGTGQGTACAQTNFPVYVAGVRPELYDLNDMVICHIFI